MNLPTLRMLLRKKSVREFGKREKELERLVALYMSGEINVVDFRALKSQYEMPFDLRRAASKLRTP